MLQGMAWAQNAGFHSEAELTHMRYSLSVLLGKEKRGQRYFMVLGDAPDQVVDTNPVPRDWRGGQAISDNQDKPRSICGIICQYVFYERHTNKRTKNRQH